MKPGEIENWKKVRSQGMVPFIAVRGVLAFGLPLFAVQNFILPPSRPLTPADLPALIVIYGVAGVAFGYGMWVFQERRYKKACAAADSRDAGGMQ